MRFKRLIANNFVGIPHAEITFDRLVTFIIGRNNQGKSSILDALQFAIEGRCRAMKFNKDVTSIIRGKNMSVQLFYEDGKDTDCEITRDKHNVGVNLGGSGLLSYCLHPIDFINLPAKERGRIISDIRGKGLKELIQQAITEHLGDINEIVLSELKASGIDVFDLDAFREQIVKQRRGYKQLIEFIPNEAPLLGDYELETDYSPKKDNEQVTELTGRIAKGSDILATERLHLQNQGFYSDLLREKTKLNNQIQKSPRIPRNVDKQLLDMAPVYISILETMLMLAKTSDNIKAHLKLTCPVCNSINERDYIEKMHAQLAAWYQENFELIDKRDRIEKSNNEIEQQIAVKEQQMKELDEKIKAHVPMKTNGEALLKSLQEELNAAQKRLAKYQLWQAANKTYQDGIGRRDALKNLVDECDRIDEALKDGGPIKAAIGAGGRELPINEKLLRTWNLTNLTWTDIGEIFIGDISVEYASKSERQRAACIMAMALSELSGLGIAAVDDEFDALDELNRNQFFDAVTAGKLNNVLVFASTAKDYQGVTFPEWMDVLKVEAGTVQKLT